MIDIKPYQSNINTDSPESQAKKKALQEAYIPENLRSLFVQSSVSEQEKKEETPNPPSEQNAS